MTPDELNQAMTTLELSPAEFSRALGVPIQTLYNWRKGIRSMSQGQSRAIELLLLHPDTAKELSQL